MAAIELELQALKENLQDMLAMVKRQMENCLLAIEKKDATLAQRVVDDEKKINAQELAIDRDCENLFALFTPVAADLRLVIATLRITNDLERIGDSAKSLAKMLRRKPGKEFYKWVAELELPEMLDILVSMLNDMADALHAEDAKPALKAAKKDKSLNHCYKRAMKTTTRLISENPDQGKNILSLFLIARNLERSGDLTKNIAEEIVFQIDARVLKHKKNQKGA